MSGAGHPTDEATDHVTVVLPGQLRDLSGGTAELAIAGPASTVGQLFGRLREDHPAIYDRIFTELREVRPHVNVFVDGADVRWAGGLETPVRAGSEVVVLPAVSGG